MNDSQLNSCNKRPNPRAIIRCILASLAFLVAIGFANSNLEGQIDWVNSSAVPSPYFDIDLNWAGGVAPTASDDIRFNIGAVYEVWWDGTTFTEIPEVRSLSVTAGDVTFLNRENLTPYRLTLSGSTGSPAISVAGGTLTLRGVELESLFGASIAGTMTLNGAHPAGARLISNGLAVDGSLNVLAGGILDTSATINGLVSISGPGSVWNAASIVVVDQDFANAAIEINDGGVVTANSFGSNILDSSSFAVTVDGEGSSFTMASNLNVGFNAVIQSGTVQVTNGGSLTSTGGVIGDGGSVTVMGTGTGGSRATWNNSSSLAVNAGFLVADSGGLVTSNGSTLGFGGTIRVSGNDSRWENSGALDIANASDNTLRINGGGVVTNTGAMIRNGAGVSVSGMDSRWENAGSLEITSGNENALVIDTGGVVTSTSGSVLNGSTVQIRDADSSWNISGTFFAGDSSLTVESGGLFASENGSISAGDGMANATFTGAGTEWSNSGFLSIGNASGVNQTGFNVLDGAVVTNTSGSASNASITIQGSGSRWTNASTLTLNGFEVSTSLMASDQATLESSGASLFNLVSPFSGNSTRVTVNGGGTSWTNSGEMGINGASLSIAGGGFVGTSTVNVRSNGSDTFESNGVISVSGNGSTLQINGDLDIGASSGLSMTGNTLVSVAGTTILDPTGGISLNGGTFEFGRTRLSSLRRFNAISGTLRGTIINDQVTELSSIEDGFTSAVILDIPAIENEGTLYGSANVHYSLNNAVGGEVEVFTSEQMRWGSFANNSGEINNFGGLIRFEGSLTNESTGFVGGRGVFIANGGIQNAGVMAFTGTTDVLGDIEMQAGSQLVTSGFATTTLFDDLIHNGLEIRTSNGSALVVLGAATGAGDYTGTGTVFFEGDLRPGNSPDIVNFDGDVVLGSFADTFIELGGESLGMFDQLLINGSLDLDGDLFVSLIDGFALADDMQFLFADVGGALSGEFNGLSEGDLVGNFGGRNLFITYDGFNGNSGVGLFTAVPEPGSCGMLFGIGLAFTCRRKKKAKLV